MTIRINSLWYDFWKNSVNRCQLSKSFTMDTVFVTFLCLFCSSSAPVPSHPPIPVSSLLLLGELWFWVDSDNLQSVIPFGDFCHFRGESIAFIFFYFPSCRCGWSYAIIKIPRVMCRFTGTILLNKTCKYSVYLFNSSFPLVVNTPWPSFILVTRLKAIPSYSNFTIVPLDFKCSCKQMLLTL